MNVPSLLGIAEAPVLAFPERFGPAENVLAVGSYMLVALVELPRTTRNLPSGRLTANPPRPFAAVGILEPDCAVNVCVAGS